MIRFVALIFFILSSFSSYAVVNVESLRANYFKDGDVSLVDGQFQSRSGNDEMWQLGASLRYQENKLADEKTKENLRYLSKTFFVVADYNKGERRHVSFIDNGFSHLRWIYMSNETWGHEYFAQHQFNNFLKLNTRFVSGANLRFNFAQSQSAIWTFGLGQMVEYEKIDKQTDPLVNQNMFYRLNSYLSFKFGKASDTIQFSTTTFYQPRFDLWVDYRLSVENEIQFRLTKLISLVLNLNAMFDNRPPQGVMKTDWQSVYKIRLRF